MMIQIRACDMPRALFYLSRCGSKPLAGPKSYQSTAKSYTALLAVIMKALVRSVRQAYFNISAHFVCPNIGCHTILERNKGPQT